jgi:hypothetical protein
MIGDLFKKLDLKADTIFVKKYDDKIDKVREHGED